MQAHAQKLRREATHKLRALLEADKADISEVHSALAESVSPKAACNPWVKAHVGRRGFHPSTSRNPSTY